MAYSLVTKSSEKWQTNGSSELNKLNTFCLFETDNEFGFPEVTSNEFTPTELIPFHMCKKQLKGDKEKGVHFFLDDYKFEQVWTSPTKYTKMFLYYGNIISPTFSVWENQPYALNLFNMYRRRWLARYYQECGVNVLLEVGWAEKDSYDYCFSGIEKGSKVILNTVGTRMIDNRRLFTEGYSEMLKRLEPSGLYVYGEFMPLDFNKDFNNVIYYPSFWAEKRDKINSKKEK